MALCSFTVLGCFVFVFFFYSKTNRDISNFSIEDNLQARSIVKQTDVKPVTRINYRDLNVNTSEIKEFIEARNNISRLLNLKQQELGRLQCEVRFCSVWLYAVK